MDPWNPRWVSHLTLSPIFGTHPERSAAPCYIDSPEQFFFTNSWESSYRIFRSETFNFSPFGGCTPRHPFIISTEMCFLCIDKTNLWKISEFVSNLRNISGICVQSTPKKAFDTLEGLSAGGGVEAKRQHLEPQGEDKGGEQNHKGSPTPDDPKGSADLKGLFILRNYESKSYSCGT